MTKKELKQKIKEEQKVLAQKIKRCRPLRKPHLYQAQPENVRQECKRWKVAEWSREYRHKHIVYCTFFNNTPYKEIERTVHEGNHPSKYWLDKYQEEWEGQLDEEVICNCA